MNKYEISVWEDFPDKTEQDIPFLNERKICIIGSNTMTSPARAREPKMVQNINGTHTFTFKMFYNYIDEYTGKKYANPFISYLINERKIKVFWQDEWYDLIVKGIDEDSNSNSITYTCKDLFITELSKNGYNIELTSDLQNNSGTANELASMVLDGSGWQFDSENSTKVYQYKEEVVYEITLSNNLSINKIVLNNAEEEVELSRGQKVLIFKSSIDQIPDEASDFTVQIHLLYTNNNENFSTNVNEMLVNNGIEGHFIGKATSLASNTRSFKIEVNNINVFEISDNNFSTRYRGKRIIKTQKTVYDKIFERYVNIYKDNSDTIVYGFSSLEFSNPLNVINLIANSSDFTGISGWQGQNLTWTVYPELSNNVQLSDYSSKGYLRLSNGTYYNSGLTANLAYFTPSQSDLKAGEIGGFNKGEKYIFRIKAKVVGTNNSVGNYITSHDNFRLDIKQFNLNDKLTPIGDSYFSLINTSTDDDWLEYTYECATSCSPKQIETLGIYIISNVTCWIEDIQFFKYAIGAENGNPKRINPGDSYLQGISQQIYKYYLPGQAVSAPEEVVFLYKGEIEQSNIYFPQFTYEKITTIEASASNRFNILQSIAENFECWIQFVIEHDAQGKILLDDQSGLPQKKVRLVEAIGEDLGWSFIYGIDLKNIKRKIISDDIATKVIVLSNNNEFGKNGFCTIARSALNYPKETFILNFDYYINQGLLNRRELELDLYSSSNNYIGYFYNLNRLNDQYDAISSSLSRLNLDLLRQQSDADTLQKQLDSTISEKQARESDIMQLSGASTLEQAKTYVINHRDNTQLQSLANIIGQLNTNISLINNQLATLTTSINTLTSEINTITSQQSSLVQNLKQLHETFFKKYARYIQEGTWQDEDYIDDNQYYLDGLQVAYTSSRPQIQYDINVVRLNFLEDYSSKKFNVGDLCYIQDKEFFNYITEDGSPYKLKIVISEITSYFDTPEKDTIKVQNYKTQFDDLFQRIVATTQSLQYSQGSYAKAASVINQDKTLNFNLLQETFDYNANLILNASNQDVTWGPDGITIRDNLNSASQLRIMSGGLFITNDGGLTWKNAIRGDGISSDLLTAGRINVGEIYIYNGDYPTFRWDKNGINAYKWNNSNVDFNTFVRYDQYGFYGLINGSQDFVPDNINDVINNATFGLTWNGFFMKAASGSGSVIINSNDTAGNVIKCINGNNDIAFSLNKNGNATFAGMITATSGNIGGWYITANQDEKLQTSMLGYYSKGLGKGALITKLPNKYSDSSGVIQEESNIDYYAYEPLYGRTSLDNDLLNYCLIGYTTTSNIDSHWNDVYCIKNVSGDGWENFDDDEEDLDHIYGPYYDTNVLTGETRRLETDYIDLVQLYRLCAKDGDWTRYQRLFKYKKREGTDSDGWSIFNNLGGIQMDYGWKPSNTSQNSSGGFMGGFIMLTPTDQNIPIILNNSDFKKDWRFIIGPNFGVDSKGNLYANSGKIGSFSIASDRLYYEGSGSSELGAAGVNRFCIIPGGGESNRSIGGVGPASGKWKILIGNNFGIDSSGNLYMNGGTINAGQVTFSAYQNTTQGGGFKCATGNDGNSNTYGAMMYGGTAGTNYFIATNAGVRMTSGTGTNEVSFYCANGVIKASEGIDQTSDRREKHDITYDLKNYESLFKLLKPVTYKYNNGASNRKHIGFISQDFEEALNYLNMDTQNFAALVKEKIYDDNNNIIDYRYGIRYSELIGLNTHMIQKLMKQIEDLQQEIENLKQ